ncbi:hypothetical protein NQ315_008121 [Exocentrus adspersus]|uniref:VWFA domain-containing protein n=1 Tax=Exocentrus adspersus TaxID=1586481 RepID=A0AAV8VW58_9CUCU|nr:hypothetical protein NQ315_008121 [Exocentrus adspersus]
MEEDSKLFLRRINKLTEIWGQLKPLHNPDNVLDKLRKRSEKIATSVKTDGSSNAGGKFEWVDSILIKCLQEGSWLLIDNVNLCSSAVLDRLNALLEPRGVLTISERGVDENGQMVEVKPHPDFRLFLTMDPKNGEISRAMRNRGIEIYMLNDNESQGMNVFDVKSLINLEGLKRTTHINALLRIHDFVSDLTLGEKPNINEILHAASLISQQINHGVETVEAFTSAVIEVYYKTRSTVEFNCNNTVRVFEDETRRILDDCLNDPKIDDYNENVSLRTQNVSSFSAIEKVKQQSSVLCKYLTRVETNNTVMNLFLNYYSISSVEDLKIRHTYLGYNLNDSHLIDFCEKLYQILIKLQSKYHKDLPYDYRWIPETPYELKDSVLSNKLNLALHLASNYFKEEIKPRKEVTLLDYMQEKEKGTLQDKFNNIIINQYLNLMKAFDKYLLDIPEQIQELQDETVIEILLLVFWRHAFHRSTMVNIKNINPTEQYNILVSLSVHYKWFYKYAVNQISLLTKLNLPEELERITRNINQGLEQQFSLMQKVGKGYQKSSNKPPPFTNTHQLQVVPVYNEISSYYNLCEKRTDVGKTLSVFEGNKKLRSVLIELKSALDYDFTDVSETMTYLTSLHEQCIVDDFKDLSPFQTQLLPVIDFISHLSVRNSMSALPKIEYTGVMENVVTVPTDFIGAVKCYAKTQDLRMLHEITKLYYLYLMNSAASRPNGYLKTGGGVAEELVLGNFSPKLTYYLSVLLADAKDSNDSGLVTLGNFRQRLEQHNHLSLILWRNMYHLPELEYDFLHTEKEYVTRTFKIFIIQLSESLKINDTIGKSLPELIDECTESLQVLKNNTSLTDINDEVSKFRKHLRNCSVKFLQLKNSTDLYAILVIISDLYMELSFMKAKLNSKLSIIDPLAKQTLKQQYCLESIDIFRDMKKINNCETLHAYCRPIKQVIEELETANELFGKYVAVRSPDVLYESVLKVVNHAFNTILSEEHLSKISSTLNYQLLNVISVLSKKEQIDDEYFLNALNMHKSAIPSYESLIHEWSNFRNTFPDIIEPLLSNVVEFLYGFKMKVTLLDKVISEYKNMRRDFDMKNVLLNLVKMPILDESQTNYCEYIGIFTSTGIKNYINQVLENKEQENFRLLRCGIQESFNHCVIDAKTSSKLDKQLFRNFVELLNVFVDSWNKQQEEKEKQEKESESLYKIKTKCDDVSEEQQIQDELQELFPNYHDVDFADFQGNVETNIEKVSSSGKGVTTYEDLKFLVNLHSTLVQNFTKTEWLHPVGGKNIFHNFIEPLLEKFKVFKKILEKSVHCLDYTVDNKLIASFNVLLSVVQRYGETNEISDHTVSPTRLLNKRKNFYKDPNVEEVKSCYHILEELKLKINELLDEWPDQPTLKTIILVIDRIYNFDITSPVSRFLTGFEILLAKCHEWEKVAHSGVSLSQYFQNITQQIIAWRKLELSLWKDVLNQTFERLNEPLAKWWLYMYNVMDQFVVEKRYTQNELIDTLQTFITKSNLAEFQGRLELLYVFHCHATYLERSAETESFISILWNTYNYFQQFSLTISRKIKDLRSPIEKKLKDYVKIVRWKDINYWAIKETVDKSHKTLHKYMREFQDVLEQPASSYLVNTITDSVIENVGIWDRPQRQSPKTYHYTLDPEAYLAKQSLTKKIHTTGSKFDEGILARAESYFLKSRKLCKQIIEATKYPSLVQTLDGFVTDVIETSSHLQKLEVDTNLPKEKQKSQAKNILQQKHRALADLFKSLSKIGLSFRTGIIESKLKNASDDFILKPIDLSANFDHINYGRKEEKILTIWDSCELYYTRSLMRADVMETALQTPAQDLGLPNIERCKGFSTHLLTFARRQKQELINSTRIYYYLRFYAKQLNEVCEADSFLHTDTVENTRNLLKNVTIVMNQCKIILNSCPVQENFHDELLETPILKSNIKQSIEYKYDTAWIKATEFINDILNTANKVNSILQKSKGIVPSTEYDLIFMQFIPITDVQGLESDLINMYKNLDDLKQMFGNVAIVDSLNWLMKQTILIGEQFEKQYPETSGVDTDKFKKRVENYAETLLLIMQNLYRKYVTEDKSQEVNEEQLQDEHLKTLIVENLFSDVTTLEMKRVLKATHKISTYFLTAPPNSTNKLKALVHQSLPLLDQIIHLYQYFITQQVSAYRVTCKMNSILLNIFIELISKGFCVPLELSGDMDSEGVSKPSDGLGLGEGQGEKDVSDKIESEDQLDDAQPAGQEKEKEEDADCKEEDKGIEMSEDFDSKLQDKEKKDDEEEDSSDDSDAEEQMGETEKNAEQLDQEIWGSDTEEGKNDDEVDSKEKEEKGNQGEKQGEDQLGAKDDAQNQDKDDGDKERKESSKDINEMEEPEYDDDQIDPHHGNQPELPEPEPMDLPDDLQLDEGQDDEHPPEENPFDIDTLKEDNLAKEEENTEDKTKDESKHDEEKEFSSDDEEITKQEDVNESDLDTDKNDKETKKDQEECEDAEQEQDIDENKDETDETCLDQSQSHQDNIEAMETTGADKVEASQSDNHKSNQPIDELCQEDAPDKEGLGQSQMEESATGHSAQTTLPQDIKKGKRELEEELRKPKPGESDSQRSLGDVNEPVHKKLKTVDSRIEEQEIENDGEDNDAEMYQHIKNASEESKTQVLDAATKEQAESQKKEVVNDDDEVTDEPAESSQDLIPEEKDEDIEMTEVPSQKPEKNDKNKSKRSSEKQHPEGDILEDAQNIDIEGDVIQTTTVPRNIESTHHTQYDNILATTANRLSGEEINSLRCEVEKQLTQWHEAPPTTEAEQAWQKISAMTESLARDLSEQLRLVLEPTQASRLKGDYRTGRRINMRKIIPYIASQFRKDKIWLRRTKPSKREYQIVLAIDDSSSMADNHSKELAFESVSLISKALTLLESGQLSVISFGETVEVLHKLTDQFTDRSGVKLLQRFRFEQGKTYVAKLVNFATEMFNQTLVPSSALNAKLLVIVSDGRGVFSEGETFVKQAIRRAKLSGIFMVFVIIDNPENKSSVLDIRMPVFKDGKLLGIENYMDIFPFSFYIILRDINSLPNVLSDALRQWFEIVSNLDKQ